jgi:hypothetical protein
VVPGLAAVFLGLIILTGRRLQTGVRFPGRRGGFQVAATPDGNVLDVSGIKPRLAAVKRGHLRESRLRHRGVDQRLQLIQKARRVVRQFAWFRSRMHTDPSSLGAHH